MDFAGKHERETRLAEFCAHALLALENCGQPGSFSITEIAYAECSSSHVEGFNHNLSEKVQSGGQEGDILPLSAPQSSDIWLENDNTENTETDIQQATEDLLAENRKEVIVLEPDQYPNPISIEGVNEVSQDG